MTGLNTMLERLGLSQYLQVFMDEGFDTWDTLMDVTESDLDTLHVKLGHRRKLQRAIIEVRGRTRDNIILGAPQQLGPKDEQYRSEEESGASAKDRKKLVAANSGSSGGQKRKYRRHPKPDEYAPERPPSAYVIFSNQMRDRLKGQDLSFTEIAKIVGERWQILSTNEKDPCERQAQAMKEKYYADLAEYKKTPQYAGYQEYLVEFKAKHNQKQENKRPKSEYGVHDLTPNTGQDRGSQALQSPSSPGTHENILWSVSPKRHEQQQANFHTDGKAPAEDSPPIPNFRRFSSRPGSEDGTLSGEPRGQQVPPHPVPGQSARCQPPCRKGIPYDPTTSNGGMNNSSPHEVPCSPLRRNEDGLPSLSREETKSSASSEHSRGTNHWSSQVYSLPLIDSSKGNMSRKLPVPSHVARLGVELICNRPLDSSPETSYRAGHNKAHSLVGHDNHSKSSIATLLRAGEQLDRDAADHTIPHGTDRRSGDRFWGARG